MVGNEIGSGERDAKRYAKGTEDFNLASKKEDCRAFETQSDARGVRGRKGGRSLGGVVRGSPKGEALIGEGNF